MKKKNENPDPIQRSVQIDCPVEDAFRLFTEGFGEWWPLAPGPESGEGTQTCEIEPWVGGRVLERSPSGPEREWGEVTVWNPPRSLEFTWHPDGPKDERQTVSVEFQGEADGTRVTLTHHGWQFAGVAVCTDGSETTTGNIIHGLVVCWASNWKPAAIGHESGASTGPIGFGKRAIAWRNLARPFWAEVFLNRFAVFVTDHAPAGLTPAGRGK